MLGGIKNDRALVAGMGGNSERGAERCFRLVTQTLVGPLVLAALSGDDHLAELAAFVVERFLDSYRSSRQS